MLVSKFFVLVVDKSPRRLLLLTGFGDLKRSRISVWRIERVHEMFTVFRIDPTAREGPLQAAVRQQEDFSPTFDGFACTDFSLIDNLKELLLEFYSSQIQMLVRLRAEYRLALKASILPLLEYLLEHWDVVAIFCGRYFFNDLPLLLSINLKLFQVPKIASFFEKRKVDS